jgi:hypothetical protein
MIRKRPVVKWQYGRKEVAMMHCTALHIIAIGRYGIIGTFLSQYEPGHYEEYYCEKRQK